MWIAYKALAAAWLIAFTCTMQNPLVYESPPFAGRRTAIELLRNKLEELGSPEALLDYMALNVLNGGPSHEDALEFCKLLWNVPNAPRDKLAAIALKNLASARDGDVETAEKLKQLIPYFDKDESLKRAFKRIRAVNKSSDNYYFDCTYQARDPKRLKAQLTKGKTFKPIPKDSVFSCIGSCFAITVAAAIKSRGVEDVHAYRYQDNADPLDVLMAVLEQDHFKDRVIGRENSVVILTAGFAETASILGDGAVGEGTLSSFLTPDAIAKSILKIADTLESWNPRVRFFVTVSPVPLYGTGSGLSPYEANAISKSIMRLGVEQARNKNPLMEYFPSYEIVTQHCHAIGLAPFALDGLVSHVNADVVQFITKLFMELYIPSIDLTQPPDPTARVEITKMDRYKEAAREIII